MAVGYGDTVPRGRVMVQPVSDFHMRFSGTIFLLSMAFILLLSFAWFMNPDGGGDVGGVADVQGSEAASSLDQILSGDFKRTPKKNVALGTGRLRGVVRDQSGAQVVGATVQVKPIDPEVNVTDPAQEIRHYWEGSSGAGGAFEFRTLPAGTFIVSATAGGRLAIAQTEVSDPGVYQELELVLAERVTRRGKVSDSEGAPVAAARIVPLHAPDWLGDSQPYRHIAVQSNEAGDFVHPLLPEGTWDVLVLARDFAPQRVTLQADRATQVTLGAGEALQGRLVRAKDGRPLNNTRVVVRATDEGGESYALRSNGQGFFSFRGLRATAYTVFLDSDRYVATSGVEVQDTAATQSAPDAAARRNVQVDPVTGVTTAPAASTELPEIAVGSPTSEGDGVTLVAHPTGSIRGRVLESHADYGVPGVRVEAFALDADRLVATATTDQAGYYHLKGLVEGGYRLAVPGTPAQVFRSEEAPEVTVVEGNQAPGITFRGVEGTELWGRVVDAYGEGVAEVNVYLNRVAYPGATSGVVTDADGQFVLRGVHGAEQVTIRAEKMGALSEVFGPVTVGSGGLQGILLRLGEPS